MKNLFIALLLITFITSINIASPPNISRIEPFQINGLDSLKMGQFRIVDFNSEKMAIPASVSWTHTFINDTDKRTIIFWDSYKSTMIAWFVEINNNLHEYAGFDTLIFNARHFYKGAVQLEEPLVAPNNFSNPDSSFTSFMCLDKSFAKIRKVNLDWNSKDISLDTSFNQIVDFYGGSPEHSFYSTGLADSSQRGTFLYRKILNKYSYYTQDSEFIKESRNYFSNQYEDIPFEISDIVSLATNNTTDLFFAIDPAARFIYSNRLGLGLSEHQRSMQKFPCITRQYPAHLFTKDLVENYSAPATIPTQQNTIENKDNIHLEVDCDAQIWFNGLRSDKICLIKDAYFPSNIINFTDSDTCYVIDLPKQLPSRPCDIKDIDGTVKGFLTITYANGIETYKLTY